MASFAFFSGFNPFGAPLTDSVVAAEASPEILRFLGSTDSILTRVGEGSEPSWTVSVPHQDIDTSDNELLDEALDPDNA